MVTTHTLSRFKPGGPQQSYGKRYYSILLSVLGLLRVGHRSALPDAFQPYSMQNPSRMEPCLRLQVLRPGAAVLRDVPAKHSFFGFHQTPSNSRVGCQQAASRPAGEQVNSTQGPGGGRPTVSTSLGRRYGEFGFYSIMCWILLWE